MIVSTKTYKKTGLPGLIHFLFDTACFAFFPHTLYPFLQLGQKIRIICNAMANKQLHINSCQLWIIFMYFIQGICGRLSQFSPSFCRKTAKRLI